MFDVRISLQRGARGVVAAFAVFAATSCSTPTSTTQLWQAKNMPRTPLKRIVVFGGGLSEAGRRTVEDGFVAALSEKGVTARPSYDLFPSLPDKESARSAVVAAGFDGALVTSLRSVRDRPTFVPGSPTGTGFWDSYYGPGWGGGYSPGYVVEDEEVSMETTLWDLRSSNGTLVWSATTKTTNPTSGGDTVKSVTREVIPKLEDVGLLPGKRTR
jgi:hypothetical protein